MAVPSSLGSTSQLATLATRADEAEGPPPTNFYALRDNLHLDQGDDLTDDDAE
jgi:hypothetical protein